MYPPANSEIAIDLCEPPASMLAALAAFERLVDQIDGAEMGVSHTNARHAVIDVAEDVKTAMGAPVPVAA